MQTLRENLRAIRAQIELMLERASAVCARHSTVNPGKVIFVNNDDWHSRLTPIDFLEVSRVLEKVLVLTR